MVLYVHGHSGSGNLAFYPTGAEAARNDNAGNVAKDFIQIYTRFFQFFGVNPLNLYLYTVSVSCMVQRFHYREVCIVEGYILTNQGNIDFLIRCIGFLDTVNHSGPFVHIAVTVFQSQFFQNNAVQSFFLEEERHFVNSAAGFVVDNGSGIYVAEQGNLLLHVIAYCLFCTAYDDIRLNTDGTKFLYAVLCRLGLQFSSRMDIWNQSYVNVENVVAVRNILLNLTNSFQEWQRFDIAYGTADFGDNNISIVIAAYTENTFLDFIGNVRNNLNSGSQVFAFSFLIDYGLVYLAGGYVGCPWTGSHR